MLQGALLRHDDMIRAAGVLAGTRHCRRHAGYPAPPSSLQSPPSSRSTSRAVLPSSASPPWRRAVPQGLVKAEGKALYGKQYTQWQKEPAKFEVDGHAPVRCVRAQAGLGREQGRGPGTGPDGQRHKGKGRGLRAPAAYLLQGKGTVGGAARGGAPERAVQRCPKNQPMCVVLIFN